MITMDHTCRVPVSCCGSSDEHVARNHHPLDVVVSGGWGAVLTDTEGTQYLDFLAAYSASNFGHRHPTLVATAEGTTRPSYADLAGFPP